MTSSGRPNDDNLLFSMFLRGCVFVSVDDLPLEFSLESTMNQPRVPEHEETRKKRT